jgi:uncharacterized protein YaaR (DUF327 family)
MRNLKIKNKLAPLNCKGFDFQMNKADTVFYSTYLTIPPLFDNESDSHLKLTNRINCGYKIESNEVENALQEINSNNNIDSKQRALCEYFFAKYLKQECDQYLLLYLETQDYAGEQHAWYYANMLHRKNEITNGELLVLLKCWEIVRKYKNAIYFFVTQAKMAEYPSKDIVDRLKEGS